MMQLIILHQIIMMVNLQLIVHDCSIKPEVQTGYSNRKLFFNLIRISIELKTKIEKGG